MISTVQSLVISSRSVKWSTGLFSKDMATEPSPVVYLAYCYARAMQEKTSGEVCCVCVRVCVCEREREREREEEREIKRKRER